MCIRDRGTGVLPRNLYEYGAQFTGIDPSENQIQQAKALAERDNMKIRFQCVSAEACDFPPHTFDAVTACQCFDYFNHPVLAPRLRSMLKENGRFAILYMAWLPEEDDLAGNSERLILKYNPMWTGCNEKRRPISIPQVYTPCFTVEHQEVFDLSVPFTRETWRGRIRSCRGIGASLSDDEIAAFDREHAELLEKIAPECFEILHYAALAVLKRI